MKSFLIILLSFFALSVSAQTHIVNDNPGIGHIVITGDSLAAGYKATDPSVTPEACLSQLPNKGVTNYAIKGQTSEQILSHNTKVLSHKPSLIFVSSGGNDTMLHNYKPGSYPAEKSYKEINTMLNQLISSGALVVYLGLDPNLKGAERLPIIAKTASQKGAIVVDGMNGLWGKPEYMADPVHPNNEGYKIVCDRILQAIQGHYP